jgi:phosphoglycolate phosphatase-like HAD superfamily hydrolase
LNDLKHFKAQAIIFDKDGTLIDFDAMWGGWVVYLAEQIKTVSVLPWGTTRQIKKFWHTA